MKTWAKMMLVGGLSTPLCGYAAYETMRTAHIPVETDSMALHVPKYNQWFGVKPTRCSAYARRAAKDIFNLTYSKANAWDRVYTDECVSEVRELHSLDELADEGVLNPGMIVGFYNPSSKFKEETDSRGNGVEFTHVALYLGQKNGEPLFAHQFGKKTRVDSLDGLARLNIEPRVVLKPSEK